MTKDKDDKVSMLEILPDFLIEMGKRMNQNKISNGGKYEPFNWTSSTDYETDKQLMIDAMQRHLFDLRAIEIYKKPIITTESPDSHCVALACNAMILWYKYKNHGENTIISRSTGS